MRRNLSNYQAVRNVFNANFENSVTLLRLLFIDANENTDTSFSLACPLGNIK